MGTSPAAATNPTSLAEPPIRSTANGTATPAIAVPTIEVTSEPTRSRKFRLDNGPRAGITDGLRRVPAAEPSRSRITVLSR